MNSAASPPEAAAGATARPHRPALTVALFALKVAASLGLLWLATRGIDFGAAFASIDRVNPLLLLIAPLALVGAIGVNAIRWQRLLAAHGAPITRRRASALVLLTQFFNSGLPSTLGGDAARIIYATRDGAPVFNVIAATILDRFAGYSSVILYTAVVIIVQPFGLELPPVWRAMVLLLTLGVPAGILVLAVINVMPRPEAWLRHADDPTAQGASGWAARRLAPLLRVHINLAAVLVAIVVSAPIVVLDGVALAAINASVCACGDLDLLRAIAIAGPLVLAVSMPISMAGWGVREVVIVSLYGLLGLPPEQGLITSVLFGISVLVSGLPGLFVWLTLRGAPALSRS